MRWTLKPKPETHKIQHLMEVLQVDEIVATLLLQRGIETFEAAKKISDFGNDDVLDIGFR